MKTSTSQFHKMVTFMEEHGDLNRPARDARGRIFNMKCWVKLTEILNSDESGNKKSTLKWKKVWSDYKTNTKRKAARIHRAATGTNAGPVVNAKLTNLEKRVLALMGISSWMITHRKIIRPVQTEIKREFVFTEEAPKGFLSEETPDNIDSRTDNINSRTDNLISNTENINSRTDNVNSRINNVNSRTDNLILNTENINSRTDNVNSRTDNVNSRTDNVNSRTDNIHSRTDEMRIREMELQNQRAWQRLASRALDILDGASESKGMAEASFKSIRHIR